VHAVICSVVQSERGLQARNRHKDQPAARLTTTITSQAMLARDSRAMMSSRPYEKVCVNRQRATHSKLCSYGENRRRKSRQTNLRSGIRLFPTVAKLREDAGVLAVLNVTIEPRSFGFRST